MNTAASPGTARLQLSTAPSLDADGHSHTLALPDALLLAWLALEGPTPRERLATLLWPDSSAEAARNALRQRLFRLRKHVGLELVSGSTVLALAGDVQHDLSDSSALLGDLALQTAPRSTAGWPGAAPVNAPARSANAKPASSCSKPPATPQAHCRWRWRCWTPNR